MGEVDEDERDCRKIDEIRRRMEERKVSKELGAGRTEAKQVTTSTSGATSTSAKDPRKDTDELKKVKEKVTVSRRVAKKTSVSHTASSAADAVQREEAVRCPLLRVEHERVRYSVRNDGRKIQCGR